MSDGDIKLRIRFSFNTACSPRAIPNHVPVSCLFKSNFKHINHFYLTWLISTEKQQVKDHPSLMMTTERRTNFWRSQSESKVLTSKKAMLHKNEHAICVLHHTRLYLCKYLQSLKTQIAVLSGVTLILRYFIETYACMGKNHEQLASNDIVSCTNAKSTSILSIL